MHHRRSRYTAVTFLLAYSPLSSVTSQPHAISWHPSPGTIDETSDHFNRTWIKRFDCGIFGLPKIVFITLSIAIFSPSPILLLKSTSRQLKKLRVNKTETHQFNWIEFTMELRKKNTYMSCLPKYSFKHEYLISEVFLLADNMCHATIIILKRADLGSILHGGFAHWSHALRGFAGVLSALLNPLSFFEPYRGILGMGLAAFL